MAKPTKFSFIKPDGSKLEYGARAEHVAAYYALKESGVSHLDDEWGKKRFTLDTSFDRKYTHTVLRNGKPLDTFE